MTPERKLYFLSNAYRATFKKGDKIVNFKSPDTTFVVVRRGRNTNNDKAIYMRSNKSKKIVYLQYANDECLHLALYVRVADLNASERTELVTLKIKQNT